MDAGLRALSDDFNGTSLGPAWTVFNPQAAIYTVGDGGLIMIATGYSSWFGPMNGALVYKEVTGNFKATITLKVSAASDSQFVPDAAWHMGGLMARRPKPTGDGDENHVLILLGGDGQGRAALEHKDTADSGSNYFTYSWPSGQGQLRICRVNDDFVLRERESRGSIWGGARTFTRPDLPATLQVGPAMFAGDSVRTDLMVVWDDVQFDDVSHVNECNAD